MPPSRKLEDPEFRFRIHQPEAENLLVEMRQFTRRASGDGLLDAQGRALVMGDDDLDRLYVGHYRGMTTDVATGFIG
jgi:hypothetical protein